MNKKTILITGASSGLGSELALQYSNSYNRIILLGRNVVQLNKIAKLCNNKGAKTHIIVTDVRDKEKMADYLVKFYNQYSIDVVIACAGVSAGTLCGSETPDQVEKIFDTNINGVINTIMPLLPHMIAKRAGSIVIISSMAGLIGLSSAPSYSASKACVRVFGEALRAYLKQYNINTTIIIPGYIKTPMTEVNNFPMPLMMSAEKAAKKIIRAVNNRRGIVAFPAIIYIALRILSFFPNRIINYINSKIPGKPSFEENT